MRHELVNPERNNIRAALDWAIRSRRQEQGLALANALENNWVTTDPDEGSRWIEALLELGTPPDEQLMAALRCLGNVATLRGDVEGKRYYEQSLELARKLGDPGPIASLLHRLAVWLAREGDDAAALSLLEESDTLNRTARLERVDASNLSFRGDLLRRDGDLEGALPLYEASLEQARRSGFAWWEKNVLIRMAFTLFELGSADEGLARAHDALRIAREMDDRPGLLDTLALAARAYALRGDVFRAGWIWGAIEAEAERSPGAMWDPDDALLAGPMRAFEGADFERGRASGRAASLQETVDAELAGA